MAENSNNQTSTPTPQELTERMKELQASIDAREKRQDELQATVKAQNTMLKGIKKTSNMQKQLIREQHRSIVQLQLRSNLDLITETEVDDASVTLLNELTKVFFNKSARSKAEMVDQLADVGQAHIEKEILPQLTKMYKEEAQN